MRLVPQRIFFTKGVGRHRHQLQSFELALRDAGIEKFNIVSVSSIVPPGCVIVTRDEGLAELAPGQIVHAVLARNSTDDQKMRIAASIGCAIPADGKHYGYLAELHTSGDDIQTAGRAAEDLAASMLATSLGIRFDPEKDWDERENQFKMSGKIVKSFNVTKTAQGHGDGEFVTVLAAAVFVPGD